MRYPHCTISIHESWGNGQILANGVLHTDWFTQIMKCPECREDIIRLGKKPQNQPVPYTWIQAYPRGSSRGPVPPDVPPSIAKDHTEAANVPPISPKASAALSRRCLQAVLKDAGYLQKDLAKQINAVLNETDSKKSLPTGLHDTLDAIRNFGNFSAHPITDQTTLQIVDVEDHEAEYCLDILDGAFDHYYVNPLKRCRGGCRTPSRRQAASKRPRPSPGGIMDKARLDHMMTPAMSQKTIEDMRNEVRAALLTADASVRAEMLVRLCLLWCASGKYSVTADDLARVIKELCIEFGIPDEEVHEAMNELLGEARREGGDAPKTLH
jgi:Domain of unknown function (DUF4145)